MYNGDISTPVATPTNIGASDSSPLNNDSNMQLSQSLDSVNTTPEDEVRINLNPLFLIKITLCENCDHEDNTSYISPKYESLVFNGILISF